jgi:Domain of Unknown Function with PDB structure (DUF3857)
MNRYYLLSACLMIFCFLNISAQDYSVASIPDSLKMNSNCVIREFTRTDELRSVNSGTVRIKKVITVLAREGESNAELYINYDRNSSVSIKEIVIYDIKGKKVKSVKQSDVEDYPAFGSSELYSEDRVKYYDPNHPEYPYTVAYEYEIKKDNIISYGVWRPLSDYNMSVQHASFTFIHPADVKINKKEVDIPAGKPGGESSELWEVSNIKAIEREPMDISLAERIPGVFLMPSRLIYDKYEGSANTWKEFGKWIYSLYQGRDQLSEAEKGKIDLMLKEFPDTLGRIKALYQYMQKRTRYVAVTLGIGGFQPFDAKTVFETGYGDCKALSNYMHSLLKYSGIQSFPGIVAAGSYKVPIFTDFPNFLQFNHVILCVPFKKDTIWLECTNQKIPFGFLGDFTDNRDVLLIDKDGGKFAHTTRYEANDNTRICTSEIRIDSTGTASCVIKTVMQGLQYEIINELLSSNYDEQKKWLYDNSKLPSLQIKSFSLEENKLPVPSARINESSVSKNFCSFSGNYMILPLNQINNQKPLQKMLKSRYSDILINRSFVDCDTLVYKLPKSYKPETIPGGANINSVFGSFNMTVSGNGNEILYIRRLFIKEGRYKATEYENLYNFVLAVSKADNTKIILSKKM